VKNRIITLDFIRTLAALVIIIYHYIHFSYEYPSKIYLRERWFANNEK
tara:strand:+ start:228 stop:371 length:144 start_codon:yes stop_codon:yes gene_type:complete